MGYDPEDYPEMSSGRGMPASFGMPSNNPFNGGKDGGFGGFESQGFGGNFGGIGGW